MMIYGFLDVWYIPSSYHQKQYSTTIFMQKLILSRCNKEIYAYVLRVFLIQGLMIFDELFYLIVYLKMKHHIRHKIKSDKIQYLMHTFLEIL